ncbi:polyprenol monophosphomannose synthase [Candidatus Actinomarina sp.]|jgi:dolichol-phosphate mannosyltransferase|nr:polyprenol monophosphomannose synthase [Candidatus Actinomarina sp.]
MIKDNSLVVTATYNEADNIEKFINEVISSNCHLLIIDDNSPDNTADYVKNSKYFNTSLFLISRESKQGYGTAFIEGFSWGLSKNYDYLISMDGDFSHSIKDLQRLLQNKDNFDLVIGSRYTKGGATLGWSLHRKTLSKYANKMAKFVTRSKINDMTTGFRIYKKNSLEKIDFQESQYNGYSFLVDLLNKCEKANLQISEQPITFIERELGKSKMDSKIIFEGIKTLIKLYFNK